MSSIIQHYTIIMGVVSIVYVLFQLIAPKTHQSWALCERF